MDKRIIALVLIALMTVSAGAVVGVKTTEKASAASSYTFARIAWSYKAYPNSGGIGVPGTTVMVTGSLYKDGKPDKRGYISLVVSKDGGKWQVVQQPGEGGFTSMVTNDQGQFVLRFTTQPNNNYAGHTFRFYVWGGTAQSQVYTVKVQFLTKLTITTVPAGSVTRYPSTGAKAVTLNKGTHYQVAGTLFMGRLNKQGKLEWVSEGGLNGNRAVQLYIWHHGEQPRPWTKAYIDAHGTFKTTVTYTDTKNVGHRAVYTGDPVNGYLFAAGSTSPDLIVQWK